MKPNRKHRGSFNAKGEDTSPAIRCTCINLIPGFTLRSVCFMDSFMEHHVAFENICLNPEPTDRTEHEESDKQNNGNGAPENRNDDGAQNEASDDKAEPPCPDDNGNGAPENRNDDEAQNEASDDKAEPPCPEEIDDETEKDTVMPDHPGETETDDVSSEKEASAKTGEGSDAHDRAGAMTDAQFAAELEYAERNAGKRIEEKYKQWLEDVSDFALNFKTELDRCCTENNITAPIQRHFSYFLERILCLEYIQRDPIGERFDSETMTRFTELEETAESPEDVDIVYGTEDPGYYIIKPLNTVVSPQFVLAYKEE